jgi:NitT/TauT family transport system substrate-binding protein
MHKRWGLLLVPLLLVAAVACGGDDDDDATGDGGSGKKDDPITLGYSAWPGWFVWAVADKEGIFDDVGVDVKLTYFADYLTSLEAMSTGKIDANSQTLNDTLVSVSAGSDQRIVITNDNSAGNDAIIVDKSITSIEGLKGKKVAAELGVVDHFLLLQGLATKDMTEDDVEFSGVLTADAAAAFANGEFDAVGVFAPFTVEALKRPGSHVLFDSSDFPGTIPDHLVVSPEMIEDRPEDVQKLVDAWYKTLEFIEAHPDEARKTMAEVAEVSEEEYKSFEAGTNIFTADEALAAFKGDKAPEGLKPMAEEISDFLVDTELAEEKPDLEKVFDESFTQDYVDRHGG